MSALNVSLSVFCERQAGLEQVPSPVCREGSLFAKEELLEWCCNSRAGSFPGVIWCSGEESEVSTALGSMGSARLDLDEQIEAGAETERSSNWFVGLEILEFSPEDWTGFWNPSEAGNEGISSEVVSLSLFSGLWPTPAAVNTHYMHQGFRRSVWIRKQTHQTRVSIQSTHHAWLQPCTAPSWLSSTTARRLQELLPPTKVLPGKSGTPRQE